MLNFCTQYVEKEGLLYLLPFPQRSRRSISSPRWLHVLFACVVISELYSLSPLSDITEEYFLGDAKKVCSVKTLIETPRGSQKPSLELERQTFTWSCNLFLLFQYSIYSQFFQSDFKILLFVLLRNIFDNLPVEILSYLP